MTTVVLGRDEELRIVARALASVADGPAACVLVGDAGIGKTALWREGVALARRRPRIRVLSCAPAEVEAALAYSCLADLLAEVEPELPGGARGAATGCARGRDAARRRSGDVAGPRAVATAVVSVLACWPRGRPSSSRSTTCSGSIRPRRACSSSRHAARGLPVGFLLSLRAGRPVPLGPRPRARGWALELVRVGPLSVGALHQLIKARLGGTFAARSCSASTARPPATRSSRSSSRRRSCGPGPPAAGGALPGSRRRARARRGAAEAAAGDDAGDAVLRRGDAEPDGRRLARGRARGVAGRDRTPARARAGSRRDRVEGESVRFEHPLFAAAIYAAALERGAAAGARAARGAGGERGAARASSGALHASGPTRRWRSPSPPRRADLRRRGAPEAAVELAELAIGLTPATARDERDRRALELGYYLMEAGDSERAGGVLQAVAEGGGALRARALLDLAGLDYWREGSTPAIARCEQALAAAAGDTALEAACHAELAVYCDNDSAPQRASRACGARAAGGSGRRRRPRCARRRAAGDGASQPGHGARAVRRGRRARLRGRRRERRRASSARASARSSGSG